MPTRVAIVPHTHWDREWYSPFQTFRLRLVRLLDALLPMLESDLSYARFLLDGQTAVLDDYLEVRPEAAAARAARELGPARDRTVDGSDGRVHGLGRDDGARPAVRDRAWLGARGCHGRRLSPRHVRPRRPDAPDAAARRLRARGGVARRAGPGGADRVLVGGARRFARAGRVSVRLLFQRPRHPRRRQATRAAGARLRTRARIRASPGHAADEWHRPSDAAALAREGRGRGERDTGRVRVRGHLLARVSRRPADGRARHRVRRVALGGTGQPAHGRRVQPGRRAPGLRAGGTIARKACRAPLGAVPPGRAVPAHAGRDRVANARAEQRTRFVVRVQQRRGRRPGPRPLLRGPPDRRRTHARRGARPRESGARPPARPSSPTPRPAPDRESSTRALQEPDRVISSRPTGRRIPRKCSAIPRATASRRWSRARRSGGCSI